MRLINFFAIDKVLSYEKFENDQTQTLSLPEVCFAGRSNVGKSTLINALLNRKKLARVSKRPGQTKTIIFYRIDNYFSLVDLPGYGYAELSKKKVAELSKLLNQYFTKSRSLKVVYVLIDSRHGIKNIDLEFLLFLKERGLIYKYIFTKSDKLTESEKKKILNTFHKEEKISSLPIIFTSGKTKEGIKELKGNILKVISKNGKDS